MSQIVHNLTDGVDEGINFQIRDRVFFFRFPLTGEVEEMQAINSEPDSEDKTKKLEGFFFGLISPVDHDQPIHDALKQSNIKVLQKFNEMVQNVLSAK